MTFKEKLEKCKTCKWHKKIIDGQRNNQNTYEEQHVCTNPSYPYHKSGNPEVPSPHHHWLIKFAISGQGSNQCAQRSNLRGYEEDIEKIDLNKEIYW